MSSEDIRTYMDIIEGRKQRVDLEEGFLDSVAGFFGNKKAQGKADRDKAAKMLYSEWQKWLGRTGLPGNTDDMMQFLVQDVDFTPSEAKEIMAHFTKKTGEEYGAQQNESIRYKNESIRYRARRLLEAPAVPLSNGQARTILDYAMQYAYQNNVWATPGNGNQKQSQPKQSQPKPQSQTTQRQEPKSEPQPEPQKEPPQQQDNSQAQKSPGTSQTVLSLLSKYGFDLADIQDMSHAVRSGKVSMENIDEADKNAMATVGWAYLKSLRY